MEQLQQLNDLSPRLIDTIGSQMHIEMTQDIGSIRQCFKDLGKTGLNVQITEFDMCLPERFMFDEKGNIRSEAELVQIINSKLESNGFMIESIADFKSIRMKEISNVIKEMGIDLEGVTYWSTSDTLDHNLERTNRKTFEQGKNREVAKTRYSGVYSYSGEESKSYKRIDKQQEIEKTQYAQEQYLNAFQEQMTESNLPVKQNIFSRFFSQIRSRFARQVPKKNTKKEVHLAGKKIIFNSMRMYTRNSKEK